MSPVKEPMEHCEENHCLYWQKPKGVACHIKLQDRESVLAAALNLLACLVAAFDPESNHDSKCE